MNQNIDKQQYSVGIVGGAGYTAGELIRLIQNHPNCNIKWIQSKSQSNKPVHQIHRDLVPDSEFRFTNAIDPGSTDLIFLCGGHGQSKKLIAEKPQLIEHRIIDLSQDFRLETDFEFIYGLPETNREKIKQSRHVANPGCFATAIQLALAPVVKHHILQAPAYITAITGSTGAGFQPSETTHFSWRSNNLSTYKVFEHQHLNEIHHNLEKLSSGEKLEILFVPVRGNFTRGILASVQMKLEKEINQADLNQIYHDFYIDQPFTHVWDDQISLKQVINTNNCFIKATLKGSYLNITAVIDNLVKGASGQALQNFNLMMGLEETTGLKLKASAF